MKTNYYAAAYEKKREEPEVTLPVPARDLLAEDGFFRVALCAPACTPGQPELNVETQSKAYAEADAKGADLVLFPPLSLTGVSLGDLSALPSMHQAAMRGLMKLAESTESRYPLLLTSLPVQTDHALIPAVALIRSGEVLAFWEMDLPHYRPELRSFHPTANREEEQLIQLPDGTGVPLIRGPVVLAEMPELSLFPYSGASQDRFNALLGIVYSCLPDLPGQRAKTDTLLRGISAERGIALAYLSPATGESGSHGIYTGFRALAEGGECIANSDTFNTKMLIQDIDVHYLKQISAHVATSNQDLFLIPEAEIPDVGKRPSQVGNFRFSEKCGTQPRPLRTLLREYKPMAFLPEEPGQEQYLEESLHFASRALAQRMSHIRIEHPILGLSGGLDSCLAQLICLRALKILGHSPQDLICVGMPGPGSSHRTKNNAEILARASGCDYREIPITDAVTEHLKAIGHDTVSEDITFENAQARERTQILMDLANLEKGFVVGTGDLSELALGWCTYNGDQMSMYSVNSTFPKTIVRALCLYEAERLKEENPEFAETILDVLATPVSPELTPGENGEIKQETEAIVGPYELHDFFLFHMLKRAANPGKLLRLAVATFKDTYPPEFIRKTLNTFLRRFVQNQFKRSASPEGVVAGPVSLSPYGFVMPGDLAPEALTAGLDEEKHFYA